MSIQELSEKTVCRTLNKIARLACNVALYLWQLPQNLLGLAMLLVLTGETRHKLSDIRFYYLKTFPGGITLGEYIIIGTEQDVMVRHEFGHVIWSRILGPLYLLVIGLPSIVWAGLHGHVAPRKSYDWFYTERWADRLGGVKRQNLKTK